MPLRKAAALEVSLPRRVARFETGIDNPAEDNAAARTHHEIVHLGMALEAEEDTVGPGTKSFGSGKSSSARRSSGRRFAPYSTSSARAPTPANTPGGRLTEAMVSMTVEDHRPVSSRTRSSTTKGFKERSMGGRVPRHVEALARAVAYS
jgi:hypothetical protein